MLNSQDLQGVLKGFQLDNPQATWEELKDSLQEAAYRLLSRKVDPQHLGGEYDLLEDYIQHLDTIAMTFPLSVNQANAVAAAKEIFRSAQRKLHGQPERLAQVYDALSGNRQVLQGDYQVLSASLSSSVSGPNVLALSAAHHPVTFTELTDAYMLEHAVNLKPSTLVQRKSIVKILNEAFETCGVLDLTNHTRADLVKVKDYLGSNGRGVNTVNLFVQNISTLLTWAVDNGLIKNNYSQRLKTLKGTESSRKGFTVDQVDALLELASKRTVETRWACSIAAVTGARLQEVLQLRKMDIIVTPDSLTMHINEDSPDKSVKNKGSVRSVPLVSTSKWFDSVAFRAFVESIATDEDRLFVQKSMPKILNGLVKAATGGTKDLVFHSLRHTVSGLLQANEVSLQTSAAILGHTTGSITFDTYGTTMGQKTLQVALEKVLPTS